MTQPRGSHSPRSHHVTHITAESGACWSKRTYSRCPQSRCELPSWFVVRKRITKSPAVSMLVSGYDFKKRQKWKVDFLRTNTSQPNSAAKLIRFRLQLLSILQQIQSMFGARRVRVCNAARARCCCRNGIIFGRLSRSKIGPGVTSFFPRKKWRRDGWCRTSGNSGRRTDEQRNRGWEGSSSKYPIFGI